MAVRLTPAASASWRCEMSSRPRAAALTGRDVSLLSCIKNFWLTIGHGGLIFELSKRRHHATFTTGIKGMSAGYVCPRSARTADIARASTRMEGEPCPRHFCVVSRPVLLLHLCSRVLRALRRFLGFVADGLVSERPVAAIKWICDASCRILASAVLLGGDSWGWLADRIGYRRAVFVRSVRLGHRSGAADAGAASRDRDSVGPADRWKYRCSRPSVTAFGALCSRRSPSNSGFGWFYLTVNWRALRLQWLADCFAAFWLGERLPCRQPLPHCWDCFLARRVLFRKRTADSIHAATPPASWIRFKSASTGAARRAARRAVLSSLLTERRDTADLGSRSPRRTFVPFRSSTSVHPGSVARDTVAPVLSAVWRWMQRHNRNPRTTHSSASASSWSLDTGDGGARRTHL